MKFYNRALPPEGAIVVVRVDSIVEYGVHVTLLEYDVEGLITAGEISRKRIRSIKEVVRVGQETAASVSRIDATSGTVDLSIRLCTPEEITTALMAYGKHRTIYNLLSALATTTGVPVERHLETFVWPMLAREEDVYERFVSLNTPDGDVEAVLGDSPHKETLLQLVAKRLPTPSFTASKIVKLTCQESLQAPALLTRALHAVRANDADVSIWVVAPPEYKFVATAPALAVAEAKVARAVETALVNLMATDPV
jgi:translation initiation factor 2 alpha subunit (eIF-2alpha)